MEEKQTGERKSTVRNGNLSNARFFEAASLRGIEKGKVPPDFGCRAIFHSWEGSMNYLKRAEHERLSENSAEVAAAYLGMIDGLRFTGLVSIGAGEGIVDEQLFAKHQPAFEYYVPVDISRWLLCTAFDRLSRLAPIPWVINCDVENLGPAETTLFNGLAGARLFACLGNVLGNTDRHEQFGFKAIGQLMSKPADWLLLSVAVGRFERVKDPNETKNGFHIWDMVFAGVSYHREPEVRGMRADDFDLILQTDEDTGSSSIVFIYKPWNQLAFTLRRYDLKPFLNWLDRKMGFVVERFELLDTGAGFDAGTFLLKRR